MGKQVLPELALSPSTAPAALLLLFATREALRDANPFVRVWQDGGNKKATLT
jgi:hypothetical protein